MTNTPTTSSLLYIVYNRCFLKMETLDVKQNAGNNRLAQTFFSANCVTEIHHSIVWALVMVWPYDMMDT